MEILRFNLNGRWVEAAGVPPTTTLLRYLRDNLGLTGTKEGCAEGDCGACTVVVVERSLERKAEFRAVNACLVLLPMVQGKYVLTVEALRGAAHHPAQEAMAKALGSQCGYCTPGIVMSMFEATYRSDLAESWKLDDQLCGNLCRCTGYRPIREAAQLVAGTQPVDRFSSALPNCTPEGMDFVYETDEQLFVTPTSLEELFGLLESHPDARLVAGGTDLSLEITKRFVVPPKLISLEGIAELRALRAGPSHWIGSTVTIAELESWAETRLPSIHRMTRYFGARQIKHRGTVGGNLCTASPIGDLPVVFLALNATCVLRSKHSDRRVPIDQFFSGYRKTVLAPQEILLAVEIPELEPTTRAAAYKVSKRRELDISTVAAAFVVQVDAQEVVTEARLGFGGMAATPKRASNAEQALVGQVWKEATVEAAANAIANDFTPMSDHRGSATYRALVAGNLLRGFFEETKDVRQPKLARGHAATVLTHEEIQHG